MTWSSWLTLATELLLIGVVLGALARLGQTIYRLVRAEIRTWRIQQEMDVMWEIERQRTDAMAERLRLDAIAKGRW